MRRRGRVRMLCGLCAAAALAGCGSTAGLSSSGLARSLTLQVRAATAYSAQRHLPSARVVGSASCRSHQPIPGVGLIAPYLCTVPIALPGRLPTRRVKELLAVTPTSGDCWRAIDVASQQPGGSVEPLYPSRSEYEVTVADTPGLLGCTG